MHLTESKKGTREMNKQTETHGHGQQFIGYQRGRGTGGGGGGPICGDGRRKQNRNATLSAKQLKLIRINGSKKTDNPNGKK